MTLAKIYYSASNTNVNNINDSHNIVIESVNGMNGYCSNFKNNDVKY